MRHTNRRTAIRALMAALAAAAIPRALRGQRSHELLLTHDEKQLYREEGAERARRMMPEYAQFDAEGRPTRLHASDFWAHGDVQQVFLDGERVDRCVEFDRRAGWVVQRVVHEGRYPALRQRHGTVMVLWRDGSVT